MPIRIIRMHSYIGITLGVASLRRARSDAKALAFMASER